MEDLKQALEEGVLSSDQLTQCLITGLISEIESWPLTGFCMFKYNYSIKQYIWKWSEDDQVWYKQK